MFQIIKSSKISAARLTRLTTKHGTVDGPFFMPIATRGAVKHLTAAELDEAGASILLSNTYHLLLKPGPKLLAKAGGLHTFMGWNKPILTDSGGFQVFSLTKHRTVSDHGVEFRDPSSGARVRLTPRRALRLQEQYGSDIIMVLDECVGFPATRVLIERAVSRTTAWAKATRQAFRWRRNGPLLFGIVQGGVHADLRERSCRELTALDFDGYAIGGLALPGIHEPRGKMLETVRQTTLLLPQDKPRYLMGVGKPEEITAAVKLGVDMFDCVIPTREARHGRLYTWANSRQTSRERQQQVASGRPSYRTVNVMRSQYRRDFRPVDPGCPCATCRTTTLAYLRHLLSVNEPLGQRLATLHNVRFYLDFMATVRAAIRSGIL